MALLEVRAWGGRWGLRGAFKLRRFRANLRTGGWDYRLLRPSGSADRRHKAITALRHRLDESRFVGIVAQGISQPFHRSIEAVIEIDEGIGWPKPTSKLFPGHQFLRPFQKRLKEQERLIPQLDSEAVLAQFHFLKVEFKSAKLQNPANWSSF